MRGYDSSLHSALDVNNIPVEVYHSLIDNVNRNLDSFHRYLKIRKRMLGVDTLKYSDLYAPTVKGVDLEYTIDEGKALVLESCEPLGRAYTEVVKEGFASRWVDVYPTQGKRSGAYSNGSAYDVHPYILLNFNGQYNDVSTLAHELGHVVHRDSLNQLVRQLGLSAMLSLIGGPESQVFLRRVIEEVLRIRFSRRVEAKADEFALQLLRDSAIDPINLGKALENLRSGSDDGLEKLLTYVDTHPDIDDRIKRAEEFSKKHRSTYTPLSVDWEVLKQLY